MFVSTYGYPHDATQKLKSKGWLTQKAADFEANAFIYRIGWVSGEAARKPDDIYVLEWNNKIIPFRSMDEITLVNKEISFPFGKSPERNTLFPVCSILVTAIGSDLKKLPKPNRSYSPHYERRCFVNENEHSYKFQSHEEYQEAVSLITKGLPVLLFDRYESHSYKPSICVEVVTTPGPWNLFSLGKLKEIESIERQQHYGSLNRKIFTLDREIRASSGHRQHTQSTIKNMTKMAIPEMREAISTFTAMDEVANKVAGTWIDEFEKAKTSDDLFEFLKTHPERPFGSGGVKLGVLYQNTENSREFIKRLIEMGHPALADFNSIKDKLSEEALKKADEFFESNSVVTKTFEDAEKIFWEWESSGPIRLEKIFRELIKTECSLFSDRDTGYDARILEDKRFISVLTKSYETYCAQQCSGVEELIASVAKIMNERSDGKKKREIADSKAV